MISILFENDDVVAVNKPEGVASIPERGRGKDDVLSLVSSAVAVKLYVVHRLDKEASGVILFAKNAQVHRELNMQFRDRSIRKTYLALAHGLIRSESDVIEKPLRQFGSGRMGVDPGGGKPCVTEFEVAERFRSHTLVQVVPVTGRRHQIRVHLYSTGHPIVGDLRYGDRAVQKRFPRLMLHARELTFHLPSGMEATIEAPIPQSFLSVLQSIRLGGREFFLPSPDGAIS